jgi:hypothetical protein
MRFEPIARGALRTTDLGVAHLFSDLTPHLRGVPVTAHRGDVEPLVRLHKINRHTRASGKDHAKAEAIFGICWLGAPDAISMFVIVIPFVSADVPQGPADRHLLLEHARSNGVDLR